jgi:hypothetical protein
MDYVYIYDELTGPPGIFANFTDVRLSFLLETFRRRKFADFVAFSNWMVVMGYVVDNGTKSIPLLSPKNGMEVMEGFHAHWRNVSEITLLVPVIVASIAWKVSVLDEILLFILNCHCPLTQNQEIVLDHVASFLFPKTKSGLPQSTV